MSNQGSKYLKTVSIAFIFFSLGVISTLATVGLVSGFTNQKWGRDTKNNPFNFFGSNLNKSDISDPFSAMENLQKQIQQNMQQNFEDAMKDMNQGLNISDGHLSIEQKEDDKYIIYQVTVDQIDKQSLSVDVKDAMVTISGRFKDENISSEYHQSFSVPENVDWQKVEIENKEKNLILKFPKL